jgi:hypothetical protein
MPFGEMNVKEEIERMRNTDPEFKKAWDDSRTEYEELAEALKNAIDFTKGDTSKCVVRKRYVVTSSVKKQNSD